MDSQSATIQWLGIAFPSTLRIITVFFEDPFKVLPRLFYGNYHIEHLVLPLQEFELLCLFRVRKGEASTNKKLSVRGNTFPDHNHCIIVKKCHEYKQIKSLRVIYFLFRLGHTNQCQNYYRHFLLCNRFLSGDFQFQHRVLL